MTPRRKLEAYGFRRARMTLALPDHEWDTLVRVAKANELPLPIFVEAILHGEAQRIDAGHGLTLAESIAHREKAIAETKTR